METTIYKWMRTGGDPLLGNPEIHQKNRTMLWFQSLTIRTMNTVVIDILQKHIMDVSGYARYIPWFFLLYALSTEVRDFCIEDRFQITLLAVRNTDSRWNFRLRGDKTQGVELEDCHCPFSRDVLLRHLLGPASWNSGLNRPLDGDGTGDSLW